MGDVDVRDLGEDALATIVNFLPKLLAFLVILLIGWLVAWLLAKAVEKVLEKVRFNRFLERAGGRCPVLRDGTFDGAALLGKLTFFVIILFTLQIAFAVFGPNPVSDLITAVIAWLPSAVVAVIILIVALYIARYVRDLLRSALTGLSYGRVLATIAFYFIVVLGVIAALNQVGIATTVTTPVLIAFLATVAGILIVGVGGGLIQPMREVWGRWLPRLGAETSAVATAVAEAERPVLVEPETTVVSTGGLTADEQAALADEAAAADDVDTTPVVVDGEATVVDDSVVVADDEIDSDADVPVYVDETVPSDEPDETEVRGRGAGGGMRIAPPTDGDNY